MKAKSVTVEDIVNLAVVPGGTCVFRGRIRSLSKLKNTLKALIPGQKSTLILLKTLTFSTK